MQVRQLMMMLETLEAKLIVYSRNWGPHCDEVRNIQSQIDEINQVILNLMVAE
jgi:hypothetical protein